VEWWPSAVGGPWTWTWRAYPGVWLLLAVLAVSYLLVMRGPGRAEDARRRRAVRFAAGLAVLWLAYDWPLGGLAAGELLTARAGQYLLVTLVVSPLLLLGLPASIAEGRRRDRVARVLRHPGLGGLAFASILVVTHLGSVVTGAAASPAGTAAVGLGWLVAALLFWWPLLGPGPDARRLPYLAGLVYLVLPFLLPKAPGLVFAFSTEPLYSPFADASAAWALSPAADQQLAGFLYWIVGSAMVLVALGVLFFRWYREDRRMAAGDVLSLPADPRAVALLFEVPGAWRTLEGLLRVVGEALPDGHRGAEIAFAYRTAGHETQVVLEVRVAIAPEQEPRLAERLQGEYRGLLRALPDGQRDAVASRLGVRLATYGSRVG
jgi:putative membrane protein